MTHIRQRIDTAAAWTAANPVLQDGERGHERNTHKSKTGDGSTAWNALPYEATSVSLTKDDVGLSEVDNTSDEDKEISAATQAALDTLTLAKAPIASPTFTGNPQAPTPTVADDDTSIATTAFVKDVVEAAIAAAKLADNPVGRILFSATNTNPSTYLPGTTWVAWGSGRVPVGVDTGQAEFDGAEETGGAKTHTLTAAEIPAHTHTGTTSSHSHNHGVPGSVDAAAGTARRQLGHGAGTLSDETTSTEGHTHTLTTSSGSAGGGSHNNLQPYITCYMFKRTA